MTGQTISHYQILEKLGEGGMGAVYKAEDMRLKRIVALKFLPGRLALTEEDRERFIREAQASAALDHPNICTIYEIDEADGRPFLAMAYIEGRSLDRRIAEGPLGLKEALDIARQAAEGLQAAHKKGIVHRDIKSSNLMLAGEQTGRPQVKLLDFGLAQLAGRSKLTQADSIMGTVAYMSPEQTEGGKVDLRSDIWSLGVVLYEMVSGELPFKGHYDQATLYSILNEDPQPLTALRSRLPVELDWIVDKCLAKDPAERYQSTDDLILDLTTLERKLSSPRLSIHQTKLTPVEPQRELGERTTVQAAPTPAEDLLGTVRRWKRWAIAAGMIAAGLLAAVITLAVVSPEEVLPLRQTLRFDINLPNSLPVAAELRSLAISPDGKRVAFTVSGEERKLWLRDLSQPSAYALDGTDGASDVFWSPDSQTVGYRAEGQLRRIPVGGGTSTVLCEVGGQYFGGASFTEDGEKVIFTSGPPMEALEVSSRGGQPSKVFADGTEGRRGFYSYPSLIGKEALLFSTRAAQGEQLGVRQLKDEAPTMLGDGSAPFLTHSGYLVYQVGRGASEIWAVPFSRSKLETTGDAFPVAQSGMLPSVSKDGTLVYMADPRSGPVRLVEHSRSGESLGELSREQVSVREPALSPDGRWVAWTADEVNGTDIWLYDRERKTQTRLTSTPEEIEFAPLWSPDNKRIAYSYIPADGPPQVAIRNADGSGEVQSVKVDEAPLFALDWDSKGRILARTRGPGRGGMVALEPQPDGSFQPQPVLEGELGVNEADVSPSGDFVVFETRVREDAQIVVRPFPSGSGRWLVTQESGEAPHWTSNGREIVYRSGGRLLAVSVERRGEELLFGEPVELFEDPMLLSGPRRPGYAISADGETILLAEPAGRPSPPTIRVVLNWLAEYER